MSRFLSFLVFFLSCSAITAQTYNDANVERRSIGSFNGIEVGTGIELLLSAGNSEEVAVSAANDEFRDRIITKVDNGVLKIYYENKVGAVNKYKEDRRLRAYVSYKTI